MKLLALVALEAALLGAWWIHGAIAPPSEIKARCDSRGGQIAPNPEHSRSFTWSCMPRAASGAR